MLPGLRRGHAGFRSALPARGPEHRESSAQSGAESSSGLPQLPTPSSRARPGRRMPQQGHRLRTTHRAFSFSGRLRQGADTGTRRLQLGRHTSLETVELGRSPRLAEAFLLSTSTPRAPTRSEATRGSGAGATERERRRCWHHGKLCEEYRVGHPWKESLRVVPLGSRALA